MPPFSRRDTKDRARGAPANNDDFIVRFNPRAPLSTWPCPVSQLRRRRRRRRRDAKEEKEGGKRDGCEPCTYVSVNDEDYRSFLAAGEKLKASSLSGLPFLPSAVQWRRETFAERTSEPATRYVNSLCPLDSRCCDDPTHKGRVRRYTYQYEYEAHVHSRGLTWTTRLCSSDSARREISALGQGSARFRNRYDDAN